MVWRAGLLLTVATALLLTLGVAGDEVAPAARRVTIAAVVLWLAPMFWPGAAASWAATPGRVLGWSLAVTLAAVLGMQALAPARGVLVELLPLSLLLLALLCLAHAGAAALQHWQLRRGRPQALAQQTAGQAVALALLALAALPLAGGPLGEALWRGREGPLDALLAASPLTHLSVAAGFDLLRSDWLYRHSNLAALPLNYPAPMTLALGYAAACALLVLLAGLLWRRDRAPKPLP